MLVIFVLLQGQGSLTSVGVSVRGVSGQREPPTVSSLQASAVKNNNISSDKNLVYACCSKIINASVVDASNRPVSSFCSSGLLHHLKLNNLFS